ncbi:kielin/chordin-like protein, partial [Saccoglossus kowalevskii]
INGKRFKNTSAVIGNGDGNVDVDETNVYVQMIKPRLMLTWNGRQHKIKIRLDDTRMYGNVYGMLGNADGFSSNDLRKSDGKFTTKFEDFGNSWEIPGSCN